MCKHAFAALQQCGVHTIPRQFVKPRWSKNAVQNHSTLGSSETPVDSYSGDRSKLKRTRAWFEFNNCMNYAGEDEDKLDIVMSGLQEISSTLQDNRDNNEVQGQTHRADKFVGPVPQK